jgi:hypothetical protein
MTVQTGQQYHLNAVHYLRKDIVFGDDDSTLSLGWVPAGSAVVGGGVVVSTAFNAGTGNVLDIGFRNAGDGTADDLDEYATDLALGTAGVISADALATAADAYLPQGAEITCSVDLTGTAATAGAGVVWVEYIVNNED